MNNKNVFQTPTYDLKNFGSIQGLKDHLEFKINAVKQAHSSIWNIDSVERNIGSSTASAKIHMTRK